MNATLFRRLAATALTLIAAALPAAAQDKPTLRILVGFPPGAGTDTLARIYGDALRDALGATVIVENKPGAGGQLAAQALKTATADSNTLMFAVDHQVVMLPLIMKTPGFDVARDMQPVARIVNFYTCLAVPASSPARSYADYVESVRKNPAQGSFGIPAPGSQAQFLGFVIGQKQKIAMNPVPYRGAAPAIQDLLGGQVPAAIVPCDALVDHHKGGRVRVLAAAAEKRYAQMPEVPTFAELGYQMPADSFLGVYAAASFKPELLRQVVDATRQMMDKPAVMERIAATRMQPAFAGPDELRRIVEGATAFWSDQVKASNFQAQ
jgi:tripartite-type tricarboxylate transporter receptor subunit TctC